MTYPAVPGLRLVTDLSTLVPNSRAVAVHEDGRWVLGKVISNNRYYETFDPKKHLSRSIQDGGRLALILDWSGKAVFNWEVYEFTLGGDVPTVGKIGR